MLVLELWFRMCITPVYIGRMIVIAITKATVATINFCAKSERFFITSTAIIDLERGYRSKDIRLLLEYVPYPFQSVCGRDGNPSLPTR